MAAGAEHPRQDGAQAIVRGGERLRQDAGLADDRHEVVVAVPARNDVGVQMGDAAAGGSPEVEADIEAVGFDAGAQDLLSEDDQIHQVAALGGRQLRQVSGGAKRDGEQMTGIVGIPVQKQVAETGAMQDQGSPVVAERRQLGKKPAVHGRLERFHVTHPPIGMELLHRSNRAQ